ncbi:MAG: ABC transporter permease subunit [Clostridiales bacterium]|nr:ABC transporter permease subunit [Clostridiales bacterium]
MGSVVKRAKSNFFIYLLILPGLLFLIIFSYIPMLAHVIAFKSFKPALGILGSPWVGLDNFRFFFRGSNWLRVTFNTLFLNALFIGFGLSLAVAVSLALNEIRRRLYKKLMQSIVFMPYFVSWMVVSFVIFAMFNASEGLMNRFLAGLGREAVSWYASPQYWPAILTFTSVWKSAGYNSVIILAAITGISGEFYESAEIDGATRFQQLRLITLPLIKPTVIILVLLAIGKIFFGDFGMIYGIVGNNTLLMPTTDVIDTFSYRSLLQNNNFGMSSAVAFYQSVMGLITILAFNAVIRRVEKGAELF